MGATSSGHTRVTRFFINSSTSALEVGKMLSMTVSQAKVVADRALAFCNTTNNRSFASVDAGKCDKVFPIDINKKVQVGQRYSLPILHFLFTINKYIKVLLCSRTKMVTVKSLLSTSTGKGSNVHHHLPSIVRKPVTSDQVFRIPCTNHFQLLTNVDSDSTDTHSDMGFESSGVLHTTTHSSSLSNELDVSKGSSTAWSIPVAYPVQKVESQW